MFGGSPGAGITIMAALPPPHNSITMPPTELWKPSPYEKENGEAEVDGHYPNHRENEEENDAGGVEHDPSDDDDDDDGVKKIGIRHPHINVS